MPSLAEASIYMRKCSTDGADHYKYVATYVEDLAIVMKDPQSLIDQLTVSPYHFKLKGSGPLNFHLGRGFLVTMTALYIWILGSTLIE